MPAEGIVMKEHRDILSYEKMVAVVTVAARLGINKVRLTGGEPLVRKGCASLVRQIKQVQGITEITLTTNGILLPKMSQELKQAGLDRVNISLDTLDPAKYKKITRIGNIEQVLAGIDAAIAAGFKNTKINMVIIPGVNDSAEEVQAMKNFCQKKGLKLQRINHYSLDNLESVNSQYQAERPLSCSQCNRIRLTADGKLKPCLFSDLEIELDFDHLEESIKAAILGKPEHGTCCTARQNWQIGG